MRRLRPLRAGFITVACGAALLVPLVAGASAASAKTGTYGWEYQCVEMDIDPACHNGWDAQNGAAGSAGGQSSYLPEDMGYEGARLGADGMPYHVFARKDGTAANGNDAKRVSHGVKMSCTAVGGAVLCPI
ncbi:hypothetical protein GCM10010988_19170 [Cnuibacter physcomitrellae]|uniref:hypothetical protein n=1 Tax=Cnuibacter physcomitrellae TaxID=1619308 RepID=UPI0012F48B69|nr:hypothetical protein [Cnuibacter physcomitrellae]GGI38471.1 hypothetical protein GCM10010988_19170 [Cnuibacter physcomitrellae]